MKNWVNRRRIKKEIKLRRKQARAIKASQFFIYEVK